MSECAHCVVVESTKYCKVKDKQIIGTECNRCPLYMNKKQEINDFMNMLFGGLRWVKRI